MREQSQVENRLVQLEEELIQIQKEVDRLLALSEENHRKMLAARDLEDVRTLHDDALTFVQEMSEFSKKESFLKGAVKGLKWALGANFPVE